MAKARKPRPGEGQIPASEVTAWYTAGEAAAHLSKNSGRPVGDSYARKLGMLGLVRTLKMHSRMTLYAKEDIDAYRVEARGKKSGAAAQERERKKKSNNAA